uniref:Uncharacterized protein n=1 Tax=Arundo donax TaxID=35708 RepID=A0A0A8ZNK9_ARUDO
MSLPAIFPSLFTLEAGYLLWGVSEVMIGWRYMKVDSYFFEHFRADLFMGFVAVLEMRFRNALFAGKVPHLAGIFPVDCRNPIPLPLWQSKSVFLLITI